MRGVKNFMLRNRKGFTLVEMIVVIAIIAILAAVIIPTTAGFLQRSRDSAALQQVNGLANAAYSDFVLDKNLDGAADGVWQSATGDYAAYLEGLGYDMDDVLIAPKDDGGYSYQTGFFFKATNGRIVEVVYEPGSFAPQSIEIVARTNQEIEDFEEALSQDWNTPLVLADIIVQLNGDYNDEHVEIVVNDEVLDGAVIVSVVIVDDEGVTHTINIADPNVYELEGQEMKFDRPSDDFDEVNNPYTVTVTYENDGASWN